MDTRILNSKENAASPILFDDFQAMVNFHACKKFNTITKTALWILENKCSLTRPEYLDLRKNLLDLLGNSQRDFADLVLTLDIKLKK